MPNSSGTDDGESVLTFEFDAEEYARINLAANMRGESVEDFVLTAALEAAREAFAERAGAEDQGCQSAAAG